MSLSYVKSIDKILRFRSFRQAFDKVIGGITDKLPAFFRFKYSSHTNRENREQIAQDFVNFR